MQLRNLSLPPVRCIITVKSTSEVERSAVGSEVESCVDQANGDAKNNATADDIGGKGGWPCCCCRLVQGAPLMVECTRARSEIVVAMLLGGEAGAGAEGTFGVLRRRGCHDCVITGCPRVRRRVDCCIDRGLVCCLRRNDIGNDNMSGHVGVVLLDLRLWHPRRCFTAGHPRRCCTAGHPRRCAGVRHPRRSRAV